MEDVLKNAYYESALGYDNDEWFVIGVITLENKMAFYFINTKKKIIMTQEDKKHFEINTVCRFCEKDIICDKARDDCHLTGEYRGQAHSICNTIFIRNKVKLFHSYHTILVNIIFICSSRD